MQTYTEMQTELLSRLLAANSSTLFTTARIQSVIKDAYMKATSAYLWPMLESAKYTDIKANQYYYEYPTYFRTDSVFRVVISGKLYERKDFEDFLNYKLENPNDKDTLIYADHARQIFIFPTPTANATAAFETWGHIQATQLSAGSDLTIFSSSDESGNEAVVKLAFAVLLSKINKNLAVAEEAEARALLATIYSKILQRKQRDQRLDHAFFTVPDLFGE
jgi:hypothetical protein